MNNRQLNLRINGVNNSAGAFKDLNRQIKAVEYQVSFFNTHSVSAARLFNAAWRGVGNIVEHAALQIQRSVGMMDSGISNRMGHVRKELQDTVRQVKTFERVLDDQARKSLSAQRQLGMLGRQRAGLTPRLQYNQQRLSMMGAQRQQLQAQLGGHQADVQKWSQQGHVAARAAINAPDRASQKVLVAHYNDYQKRMHAAQKATAQVQNQIKSLDNQMGNAGRAASGLQNRIAVLDRQLQHYNQVLAQANAGQRVTAQQMQAAQSKVASLSAQMAKLQQTSARLQQVQGILQGLGQYFNTSISLIGAWGSFFLSTVQDVATKLYFLGSTVANFVVGALKKVAAVSGIVAAGILGIGAVITKAGSDFNSFSESALISFEVMLGSADKAKKVFHDLKVFADITPFDTKEVIDAGKLLTAYGLDMYRWISIAGNMAAAFNKPLDQAIGLLGRAKAGMFDAREYAPLGVTRENLIPFGVKFDKQGAPVDRSALLPGIEKLVNSRYAGMMERQAFTDQGLTSTLKAFWTEDFPGAVTQGWYLALKQTKAFLLQIVTLLRNNGGVEFLAQNLSKPFTQIGNAIFAFFRANVPKVIAWFTQLVNTGKWDTFVGTVSQLFTDFFNFLSNGFGFVMNNWDKIWGNISNLIFQTWKTGGAILTGIVSLIQWLIAQNPGAKLNEGFKQLKGTLVTIAEVIATLVVGTKILQAIKGAGQMTLGAASGNTAMAVAGGIDMITGGASAVFMETLFRGTKSPLLPIVGGFGLGGAAGQLAVNALGPQIIQSLQGILGGSVGRTAGEYGLIGLLRGADFGAIGQSIGGVGPFPQMQQDVGGWNTFADNYRANFKPAQLGGTMQDVLPPGMSGLPAPIVDDSLEKNRAAHEEMVKLLKEEVKLWEAISEVSDDLSKIMGDQRVGAQLQQTAIGGLLSSMEKLKTAQYALLQLQDFGEEKWYENLTALNENIQKLNKIRDTLRDILFTTERIRAASDTQAKIIKLAQESGAGQDQIRNLMDTQLNMLLSMADTESKRLATLDAGTTKWHEQRGLIVDIFTKIVDMRKELEKINNIGDEVFMGIPQTPYGQRGASFGPELIRKSSGMGSGFGNSIMGWLMKFINPSPRSLESYTPQYGPQLPPANVVPKLPANGASPGYVADKQVHSISEGMIRLASNDGGFRLPKAPISRRLLNSFKWGQPGNSMYGIPGDRMPGTAMVPRVSPAPNMPLIPNNRFGLSAYGMGAGVGAGAGNPMVSWPSMNVPTAGPPPALVQGLNNGGLPRHHPMLRDNAYYEPMGRNFPTSVNLGQQDPKIPSLGSPWAFWLPSLMADKQWQGSGQQSIGGYVESQGNIISSWTGNKMDQMVQPAGPVRYPFGANEYTGGGGGVTVNAPITVQDNGSDLNQLKAEIMGQMESVVDATLLKLAQKRMNRGGVR